MNRFGKICIFLGIIKKVKVSEGRFETFEYYRFRLWNPFTWLFLFILCSWNILIGIYNSIHECYDTITDNIVIYTTKEDDNDYD